MMFSLDHTLNFVTNKDLKRAEKEIPLYHRTCYNEKFDIFEHHLFIFQFKEMGDSRITIYLNEDTDWIKKLRSGVLSIVDEDLVSKSDSEKPERKSQIYDEAKVSTENEKVKFFPLISFNLNFGSNKMKSLKEDEHWFKRPIYCYNAASEFQRKTSLFGSLPNIDAQNKRMERPIEVVSPSLFYLPAGKKIKFLISFIDKSLNIKFNNIEGEPVVKEI